MEDTRVARVHAPVGKQARVLARMIAGASAGRSLSSGHAHSCSWASMTDHAFAKNGEAAPGAVHRNTTGHRGSK